jgi:hypothetical protein
VAELVYATELSSVDNSVCEGYEALL